MDNNPIGIIKNKLKRCMQACVTLSLDPQLDFINLNF